MEHKRLAVELKADAEGALKAVFATFGVVDNDGDVTLPGAFETGRKVPIAGVGHNWNTPTIGGGTIMADETAAWLDGLLNLKMVSAREHYESIRFDVDQGINRQEYSYAYDVLKGHSARPDEIKQYGPATKRILEKLLPHEVSPVLLGAGIGTGTLYLKGRKRAPLSDEQRRREIQDAVAASSDNDWYFGPYVVATYPDRVVVCEDGEYTEIAYTMDAAGLVTLGAETPVDQTYTPKAMDLATRATKAGAVTSELAKHARAAVAMRAKEGRVLSTANHELLSKWVRTQAEALTDVRKLLEETKPSGKALPDMAILRSKHHADVARLRRTLGIAIPA